LFFYFVFCFCFFVFLFLFIFCFCFFFSEPDGSPTKTKKPAKKQKKQKQKPKRMAADEETRNGKGKKYLVPARVKKEGSSVTLEDVRNDQDGKQFALIQVFIYMDGREIAPDPDNDALQKFYKTEERNNPLFLQRTGFYVRRQGFLDHPANWSS
jgi:hypothetical protein